MMDRRQFLGGLLVAPWLASCRPGRPKLEIQGEILGANHQLGHRLRETRRQSFQGQRQYHKVLVLGGGIAGLCAAWRLSHAGLEDYQILELESSLGGNSRAQHYPSTPAPWGAHYLPVPTRESRVVRRILQEMNLLLGIREDGTPLYDHHDLCHMPEERIYVFGRWEAGLFPVAGCQNEDLKQLKAFEEHIEGWQSWRDRQGRKAFALPLEFSSRDPELLELDRMTMADYLQQKGWNSPRLRWYVDYGCRDDYGTSIEHTSAWAGLHYFACRDGGGLDQKDAQFVWPEGNHRLVQHLSRHLKERWRTGSLVAQIRRDGPRGYLVDCWDEGLGGPRGYRAERLIFALPTFQRPFLLGEKPWPGFTYSPWTVTNLELERIPPSAFEAGDVGLCWDNVLYQSPSLGYVSATHQSRSFQGGPGVFTHYRPWSEFEPGQARKTLLSAPWSDFRDLVLAELSQVHPEILQVCRRLDVMHLGHAMVRPLPGFLWGQERRRASLPGDGIYFGHSDLSGISIFEEASFQGVRAAQELLKDLGLLREDFL